jgi:hypothetical protein
MTDPTPHHRRSPLEHERDDAATPPRQIWAAPDDVEGWARIGRWNVEPGWREGDRCYIRDDVTPEEHQLITALRARLKEAEAERMEQARLLGRSAEVELALRARLEEAEARMDRRGQIALQLGLDAGKAVNPQRGAAAEWQARAERAEAAVERAVDVLRRWQREGCPDCSGDCASANPPVARCIMQETRAAIAAEARGEG